MATRTTQTRAKFAYLKYESMLANLADSTLDKKVKLDAYDINFTPDTKECYVIAPDLTPWAIKSKVYVFESIEEANEQLNSFPDTYSGQIVAIRNNEKYFGYIVNKNETGFFVNPLSEHADEIDYNELGNRPIINLVGTLDEPIMISDLAHGSYRIDGNVILPNNTECSIENYFVLISEDTITTITSDKIIKYQNDKTFEYITDDYLVSKGYITKDYVDNQILALDEIINEKVQEYVNENTSNLIQDTVSDELDKRMVETYIFYGGSAKEEIDFG